MENQKTYKTPSKDLVRMQVVHLGTILFKYQFVVLAIMLASVFVFIAYPLYYLFLIMVILITLGMVLMSPEFMNMWNADFDPIVQLFADSWKYTAEIAVALAIGSIICFCFDKSKKHIGHIVTSIIYLILCVGILLFKLLLTNTGVTE